MEVLAVTILVSVILAVLFLICFTFEMIKPRKNSLEHTSLLPLDEKPDDSSDPEISHLKSK
jgi:hypothetical protein